MESVWLLPALAASNGWEVHHLDLKSAFLNGDLAETVFVKQAPGFVVPGAEHKVLRLRKALYGLRQAPRAWNAKLDTTLRALGFERCETEHAIYVRRQGKFTLINNVYVDDLIVTGDARSGHRRIQARDGRSIPHEQFGSALLLPQYRGEAGERGDAARPAGVCGEAARACGHGGLQALRHANGGQEERLKLSRNSTMAKVAATLYRSIVGGFRYLTHTRPDITFAVGYVSRFMGICGRTTERQ
jgi:hypothetical protein